MIMRPDERAAMAEIEREENLGKNIKKGIGAAATLGAAALGGGLADKIVPFLSKYIPTDLAIKGISKISPQLGDFLKRGQSMGLNVEDGLQNIKDEVSKEQSAKENRNIIQQYSPELDQFILEEVKKGRSILQAGALAELEQSGKKGFKKIIEKITKDHKVPWSAILETVYGQDEQPENATNGQKKEQNPEQQQSQVFYDHTQQQQQSAQGIDPALLNIMTGIRGAIKNIRGPQ